MESISQEVARYVASCKYEDIPADVIDITKTFILDTIGVGMAGTNAPGYQPALKLFRDFAGKEDATVMFGDVKLPAPSAAFLNTLAFHACDFDDTYDEGVLHCYCSALGAALAAAQRKGGVSGKELLTAVAVGVDVCARLGRAIKTPLCWVRTATCGTFGAAAAAAKVLGLDETGVLNALGVVYSQTAGNAQCQNDGGLSKRMQPGFSARSGVLSALLAEQGITGARLVFEGPFGFFNLYERGQVDPAKLTDNLGTEFLGRYLSIKPYPSCRMTHAAIDAALLAKEKYQLRPEQIDHIEIYTSEMCKNMVGSPFQVRTNPQVDAQFSIPYTVSVALAECPPSIPEFDNAYVQQERWKEAAAKVVVLVDPELPAKELRTATLKAYLKSGETVSYRVDTFRGHPDNPLSMELCKEKFMKCAALGAKALTNTQLEQIMDAILSLEQMEDIEALATLLA